MCEKLKGLVYHQSARMSKKAIKEEIDRVLSEMPTGKVYYSVKLEVLTETDYLRRNREYNEEKK